MSHATMEKFRSCPICFEVPEKEIYQCSNGHILCSICLPKMRGKCPQCRTSLGRNKIRSRVLEEILDGQEFECKFNGNGCFKLLKRAEITSHAHKCHYNPDLLNLCRLLCFKEGCEFKVGGYVPRSDIVSHFETVHHLLLYPSTLNGEIRIPGKEIRRDLLSRKRKCSRSRRNSAVQLAFFSADSSETSPLFLLFGKLTRQTGLVSYVVIQLWGSPAHATNKYQAEFQLNRGGETLSTSSSSSSSSTAEENEDIRPSTMNVFPIRWILQVYPLKEAGNAFAESPMNIPISLLERNQFGVNKNDSLVVKINRYNYN